MRIELSKKELSFSANKSKIEEYLKELDNKLKSLLSAKEDLQKNITNSTTSTEEIVVVRNKLKSFLTRILAETPDIQNMLLKESIESITYNLINSTIAMHLVIKANDTTLLDKFLYASF